jgi:hypothetical protein
LISDRTPPAPSNGGEMTGPYSGTLHDKHNPCRTLVGRSPAMTTKL